MSGPNFWERPPEDDEPHGRRKHQQRERQYKSNGHEAPPDIDETLPFTLFANIKPALEANDFVEELLTASSLAVVYGEPGSGKTFWVLDICLHVAAGRRWEGRTVDQGAVVYLALEGGAGIRNRVSAAREQMELPADTAFVLVQRPVDLCRDDADVARIIATIRLIAVQLNMPVRLVVIDTLARALAGGNENSSEDMGALVSNSDEIRHETGACVLYIHHSGKDVARGTRGHSSLKAACDTEIEVTRTDGTDGTSVATVTRQRDLEGDGRFAFKLHSISLGDNDRGKPVTSCVVMSAEAPPPRSAGEAPLTPTEKIALRTLDQAMRADGIMAWAFDDGRVQGLVVREADWRVWFYREGKPGADQEAKKKAFQRAVDGLMAKGRIGARDDLVWPKQGDRA